MVNVVPALGYRSLWQYRALVGNFAQRELKSKYKGSLLGWAWSLGNPIATLVIYTLVFSTIFKQVPPRGGSGLANYTVYLFSGLVVWNFFVATVTGGMGALIGAGPLLRKIFFPAYVPVLGNMISVFVQTLIESAVLLVVLAALGNAGWAFLLVPFVLALLILFTVGIALMLSLANVYARDMNYLVTILLQMLFYATPIIYSPLVVQKNVHNRVLRHLLLDQPLAQYVDMLRSCAYGLRAPDLLNWAVMTAVSLAVFALGWAVFAHKSLDVSEEL